MEPRKNGADAQKRRRAENRCLSMSVRRLVCWEYRRVCSGASENAGRVACVRIGRAVRYCVADLHKFIGQHKQGV